MALSTASSGCLRNPCAASTCGSCRDGSQSSCGPRSGWSDRELDALEESQVLPLGAPRPRPQPSAQQALQDPGPRIELLVEGRVDAVEHARHGDQGGGPDLAQVLDEAPELVVDRARGPVRVPEV